MKRSIWHQNYITLREQLLNARLDSNMTQIGLSKMLDKPQSFIAKYENGDRNLDIIELILICRALNVDVTAFVKELNEKI